MNEFAWNSLLLKHSLTPGALNALLLPRTDAGLTEDCLTINLLGGVHASDHVFADDVCADWALERLD